MSQQSTARFAALPRGQEYVLSQKPLAFSRLASSQFCRYGENG